MEGVALHRISTTPNPHDGCAHLKFISSFLWASNPGATRRGGGQKGRISRHTQRHTQRRTPCRLLCPPTRRHRSRFPAPAPAPAGSSPPWHAALEPTGWQPAALRCAMNILGLSTMPGHQQTTASHNCVAPGCSRHCRRPAEAKMIPTPPPQGPAELAQYANLRQPSNQSTKK